MYITRSTSSLLRAGLAAGTIGTLISASALFANIAAAETTGYQTGYTYHQGLATGAGANLVEQSMSGARSASPSSSGSVSSQSSLNTDTSASTPSSASVDTTGAGAATLDTSANTSVAQAAAVEPAATADTNTSAAANASGVLASQPFMMALWVLLGLAVLALIAMGISAIANALSNSDDSYEARRSISYQ